MLRCGLLEETGPQLFPHDPSQVRGSMTTGSLSLKEDLCLSVLQPLGRPERHHPLQEGGGALLRGAVEAAERLQSVNTLVHRPDGTLYGDNTDLFGFLYMVRRSSCPTRRKKGAGAGRRGGTSSR